jgi:hypothetical protein
MTYSLKEYFGGKTTQAYADYKAGQKAGQWSDLEDYIRKGGTNTGYISPQDAARKIQEQALQAVQPAVQSYQAQLPEVGKAFDQSRQQMEAERDPLIERYQSLLDDIKGRQQTAENRQTVATSEELGKRGITGSSTLAQQEMANALNPITSEFTGMTRDVGLSREADLRNLANMITGTYTQQTDAERQIHNAIGQLLSGAGMTGLNLSQQQEQFNKQLAQQQLAQMQQASQWQDNLALNKQQQAFQDLVYRTIQLPESQYKTSAPYYKPTSGAAAPDYSALLGFLGGGGNTSGYTSSGVWEVVKP